MEFDYSLDFNQSLLQIFLFSIISTFAIFSIVLIVLGILWLKGYREEPSDELDDLKSLALWKKILGGIGSILFYALFLAIVLMLLIYPFIGLVKQYHLIDLDLIRHEITTGILPLRLSSLAIGSGFVLALLKGIFIVLRTLLTRDKTEDFKGFYTLLGPVQYFFYAIPIILLWVFTLNSHQSQAIALLSWAIAFIIDDWAIINSYTSKYGVRPLRLHVIRLVSFNIGITILSIYCVYKHYNILFALLFFLSF